MPKSGWKAWEADVASQLGLDLTTSSGNKFFDPGDAVTRGRPDWPVYAECKYTEHATFILKLRQIRQAHYQAIENGRRFLMPIRMWPQSTFDGPGDYCLLPMDDLVELIEKAARAA